LSLAFTLLLITIVVSPAVAIFDGLVAHAIVAVLAIAALSSVAISARAADVNFAARVTRSLKLAAAVPAVWMVIQLLPLPFGPHSIWINANEALGQQSWGHISIDLSATVNALAFYLSNVGLVIVSLFVVRDRRRAELILFALAAITTLTTIVLLIGKLAQSLGQEGAGDVPAAVSSLGVISSLTLAAYGAERYQSKSKRAEPSQTMRDFQSAFVLSGLGLLVSIVGLATSATLNVALTALFAVIVFASVQAIRRVGLPNWAAAIVLITMVTAAAMIILWRYDATRPVSRLLQFATAASPDAISMAQRILLDTTWQGTGAGTFAQLAPIYQEFGNSATTPPTTAAAFAIELGWPMTLFTFGAALALIVVLYRGALVRGRDSFYPAGAAAFTVGFLGQAFCDASLFNSCVAVIGDTMIGLGLAQSASSGDSF
jgi:hypothetical protein